MTSLDVQPESDVHLSLCQKCLVWAMYVYRGYCKKDYMELGRAEAAETVDKTKRLHVAWYWWNGQCVTSGKQMCSCCVTKASPECDLEVPSLKSREPKINCNVYRIVSF